MNDITASQDDRNLAMLTHLSGILFGFIVPLIIWLTHKDKPEKGWLTAQALEALNFQITMVICFFVSGLLIVILIGGLLLPLVWILDLVFCIIAGMAASRGENYRYPFALRLLS
jgi:uncharacterized Tic20 family protein